MIIIIFIANIIAVVADIIRSSDSDYNTDLERVFRFRVHFLHRFRIFVGGVRRVTTINVLQSNPVTANLKGPTKFVRCNEDSL